jgi:hypothetical protein
MGGNPSELFFLLSHKVKVGASSDGQVHIDRIGADSIRFSAAEDTKMKDIRQALTRFIDSHPDKKAVTSAQLSNPSWLRDQKNPTLEMHLLSRALEEAYALVESLDVKAKLKDQISEAFSHEYEEIEKFFLQDMRLPLSYFKDLEKKDREDRFNDPMRGMLEKHPVWGVRYKASGKRQSDMENQLLSQEDFDKMNFIGSNPSYIALFAMRTIIQIERMVNMNLDEKVDWLSDINKKMNK